MNIERLRIIQQMVKANPDAYNQQVVFASEGSNRTGVTLGTCGSASCLAGKAIVAFHPEGRALEREWLKQEYYYDSFQTAGDTLDLTEDERERLFQEIDRDSVNDILSEYKDEAEREFEYNDIVNYQGDNWPWEFAKAYVLAKTPEERAQAAIDRIEHFIATNGKE